MVLNRALVGTAALGFVCLVGMQASASGYRLGSVSGSGSPIMDFLKKGDATAIQGQCVPPLRESAADILNEAGVHTVDATVAEAKTLAKGIQKIEQLAGGNFEPIRGASMHFYGGRMRLGGYPFGRFNGSFVEIHRAGSNSDTNLAHLMHELGHWVGAHDGLYDKYKESVSPCQYSSYCKFVNTGQSPRNEEFAEVWAAFITHPEILYKGSPNCKRAYNFFANEVFAKGKKFGRCNATDDLPTTDKPEASAPVVSSEKRADKADEKTAPKVEFKLAPKPNAIPAPAAKPIVVVPVVAPVAKPAPVAVKPVEKPATEAKPAIASPVEPSIVPRFRTRPVHPVTAVADPAVVAKPAAPVAAKPIAAPVIAKPASSSKPVAPSAAKPVASQESAKPLKVAAATSLTVPQAEERSKDESSANTSTAFWSW